MKGDCVLTQEAREIMADLTDVDLKNLIAIARSVNSHLPEGATVNWYDLCLAAAMEQIIREEENVM